MKRSLLLSLCAVAIVAMSLGQAMATITLSLNLRYTNPASTAAGGAWDLLARTDNVNGISGLSVVLDNIDFGSVSFNGAIDGIPIETRQSGTITEFVWGYDVNATAGVGKFADVGNGAGTPGNVAKDDLFPIAANAYDNMALIASGTFGASRPAFATFPGAGGGDTAGQNWTSAAMTAGGALDTIVLGGGDGVRGDSVSADGLQLGDANRDGRVNGDDLNVVLLGFNTAGQNTWDLGDFNNSGTSNGDDLNEVLLRFNVTNPVTPAFTAVPEPSTVLLAIGSVLLGLTRRRVA